MLFFCMVILETQRENILEHEMEAGLRLGFIGIIVVSLVTYIIRVSGTSNELQHVIDKY